MAARHDSAGTAGQGPVGMAGPVVLASDAVHYYEELERDRPFSTVASLPDMYAAFDQIRELARDCARVVAGHDPLVAERFPGRAGCPHVIQIAGLPRDQTPQPGQAG